MKLSKNTVEMVYHQGVRKKFMIKFINDLQEILRDRFVEVSRNAFSGL